MPETRASLKILFAAACGGSPFEQSQPGRAASARSAGSSTRSATGATGLAFGPARLIVMLKTVPAEIAFFAVEGQTAEHMAIKAKPAKLLWLTAHTGEHSVAADSQPITPRSPGQD